MSDDPELPWHIAVCWVVVFVGFEGLRRACPGAWPAPEAPPSGRPRLDLVLALLVPAAILGLGQLWFAGTLRWHWPGAWGHLAYVFAQLLVWSPLLVALVVRRQAPATVWVPRDHLLLRLAAGSVLGLVAVAIYLLLMDDSARWPAILGRTVTPQAWAHAVPVFLEACGVAFVFVRLRWALGRVAAALVPGVLFALAHVPRALEAGEPAGQIAVMLAVNTALVALLIAWAARFRDLVAVGAAHWLWDLAIGAF